MPWTQKQHSFFALCQSKGRKKARKKCPSVADARKMMKEGIKK